MNKLFNWIAELSAPAPLMVTFIVLLMPGFIIAGFSACSAPKPVENHGWRETEAPRPDLQCWVRWSDPKSTVCAPSLTSTHGASK